MERYNVVVGAVVIESDAILLLQRSLKERFLPGAWGIPAGKATYGEALHDAVVRELREEAGLLGRVSGLCGSSWFESSLGGERIRNVQVNFVIHVDSRDVHLDGSSQAYMWVRLEQINDPTLPIDEFTRNTITGVLSSTNERVSTGQLSQSEQNDEHLPRGLTGSWIPDSHRVTLGRGRGPRLR